MGVSSCSASKSLTTAINSSVLSTSYFSKKYLKTSQLFSPPPEAGAGGGVPRKNLPKRHQKLQLIAV